MAPWTLKVILVPRVWTDRCPFRESQDQLCCPHQIAIDITYQKLWRHPRKTKQCQGDNTKKEKARIVNSKENSYSSLAQYEHHKQLIPIYNTTVQDLLFRLLWLKLLSVKETSPKQEDKYINIINSPGTPSSTDSLSPNSLAHSTQSSIVASWTGMNGHTSIAPILGCSPLKH